MTAADKIKALPLPEPTERTESWRDEWGYEHWEYAHKPEDLRALLDAAAAIAARQDAVMAQVVEAAAELHACHTESAGFSMSMMKNRAEFDAFIQAQQERIERAVGNLGAALQAHKEQQ